MVQINFAQKQVNAKIVYYGPGMSGKTTNLEIVHQRAPTANRGDLTSISTDGDRTLFFDFMPLDLGTVAGMRTCFQIYTVPGQVYYNSTRKLVLQGVDGVVFVADSSSTMVQENLESLKNLEQNLNEYGKSLSTLPHIVQFNKRDLPDAMSVPELNKLLNAHNAPFFEAIANTGQGVFPTLKALAARVLETIHTGARPGAQAASPSAPVAPGQASVASSTGYGQRPLQQTGYANMAHPPGAQAPASIPIPQRAAVPAAQGFAPTGQFPAARGGAGLSETSMRSAGAAPAGAGFPPQPPASIPMQAAPRGQFAPPPGAMAPNLQMMRGEPAAPAPAAQPRAPQPAPIRPAPRPQPMRPAPPRAATPKIATGKTGGKKKQFTTFMLVVAALVAGAVMAVAVLS